MPSSTQKVEVDLKECIKDLEKISENNEIYLDISKTHEGYTIRNLPEFAGTTLFLLVLKKYKEALKEDSRQLAETISKFGEEYSKNIQADGNKNALRLNSKNKTIQKLRELRKKEEEKKKIDSKSENFDRILRNSELGFSPEIMESKKFSFGKTKNDIPGFNTKLDRNQIYFSKNVNPHNWVGILTELEKNLETLEYEKWYNLPVMIVEGWNEVYNSSGINRYPGFVIIPSRATINGNC
ncbi:hypothetical protein BB558_001744 [Smittium angustum]|uniref:Uncharacterized protein n=1 Tax=Smittium angustum TaxID=133377 RepID=A0A2U1JAW4_SMIAN|nr:hypothetical protein BB558_001744 [Smittium angustum]